MRRATAKPPSHLRLKDLAATTGRVTFRAFVLAAGNLPRHASDRRRTLIPLIGLPASLNVACN